jgi:diaminohydroxyphosphoribosylaminopyrimidine deaminase/5-amino-6-(5-phosphoribosylamino)uracil reductase
MRRALDLARKGRTHPNPRVGAIVIQNGDIAGVGWHAGVGTPHAEAAAFADAASRGAVTRGATLYVTLEPCAHTVNADGTPRIPCAVRCLEAGIAHVVCAMEDPDERVAGRGFATLRSAGVSVTVGVEEAQARALNAAYVKHRTTGLPYVLHKAAMTLDGKIAAPGGDARWITGERARAYVHRRLRDAADAIVVGVGTILADDPELTTRLPKGNGHNPLRVVIDSTLRTPPVARVARKGTLFLAAAGAATAVGDDRAEALRAAGAEVVLLPSRLTEGRSRVDVREAVRLLADRGALSLLLESGGELAASFWQAGLIDGVIYFVAPKIIGGRNAATPVDGDGVSRSMMDAVTVSTLRVRRFGPDIALEGEVKR